MTKLFIIAGHGAGDPGACANGYSEAERVRALASKIKKLGGSAVKVGDTSVNWYASNYIGKGKCPKGVPVIELHMDSAMASARGGHVEIKQGFSPDSYDKALGRFITKMFPGRADSGGIRYRSDLANVNRAAAMGVNYRLLECCFISNASDVKKFNANLDELAEGILESFGIKKASSSSSSSGSTVNVKDHVIRIKKTLNVRSGAGLGYKVVDTVKPGEAYTITHTKQADGVTWGKLKSGAGWVSLASSYSERV